MIFFSGEAGEGEEWEEWEEWDEGEEGEGVEIFSIFFFLFLVKATNCSILCGDRKKINHCHWNNKFYSL